MLYIVVGVAAGVGLVLGLLPGLAIPADHLLNSLVNASESAAAHVVGHHLTSPNLHGVALVASVLIPVLVPGLVVTAMVLVAQASFEIRKAAAAIALLGSLASFLVLPASSASALLLVAAGSRLLRRHGRLLSRAAHLA